jgi:hypothetical protein
VASTVKMRVVLDAAVSRQRFERAMRRLAAHRVAAAIETRVHRGATKSAAKTKGKRKRKQAS